MENAIHLSDNGYNFLSYYLTELYGERGKAKHNIIRYLYSDEFRAKCKNPNSVESIPELSVDQIKNLILRENHFKMVADKLVSDYTELEKQNKLTKELELEIGGVFGVCPGPLRYEDRLFPHVVDFWVKSMEEENEILKSVHEKPNVVNLMVRTMIDHLRKGQIYEHDGRYILSQGYARNYFRGERAYYGKTKASMFRNLSEDANIAKAQELIREIKIIDFAIWLNTIDSIKNWPYSDIFHGAIAQHYGMETNVIDVTSDIMVALFFACCKYDKTKKQWLPLCKSDFEFADSDKDIAKLGGDSRYGVLFAMPADVSNLGRVEQPEDFHVTEVTPIGIQPFLRCPYQSAYIIESAESYDMYKDLNFAKVKFRHTEEFCRYIYDEMDEGRKIYPEENTQSMERIIKRIKDSKEYSLKAFNIALQQLEIANNKKEDMEIRLQQLGYKKEENIQWANEVEMSDVSNLALSLKYLNENNINPVFRIQFSI
ncbi:MAG: FRG domain-containing protein [Clostridia bacterium]|nr:FRG domain-containing protein [Clostridia bacterium]